MKFWERLIELFSRESPRYITRFISEDRVLPAELYDHRPIGVGEAYIRLTLVEMRLARDVEFMKSRYPVVHSAVSFNYGGQAQIVPYVAGPELLKKLDPRNLAQSIQRNQVLTPLFPFNGGTIRIQAGLLSLVADDPIRIGFEVLGTFAAVLPSSGIEPAIKIGRLVYDGLEKLFDIGDGRLELGYDQTFVAHSGGYNTLRAGYFAVVLADPRRDAVDPNELCVVDDELHLSAKGSSGEAMRQKHRPLDGYSYMLFKLERHDTQDYELLSEINDLRDLALQAVFRGEYEQVRTTVLPAIKSAVIRSPDLTRKHRGEVIVRIEQELRAHGLQGQRPEARESLSALMRRPLPPGVEWEAELARLERLYTPVV